MTHWPLRLHTCPDPKAVLSCAPPPTSAWAWVFFGSILNGRTQNSPGGLEGRLWTRTRVVDCSDSKSVQLQGESKAEEEGSALGTRVRAATDSKPTV